METHVDCNGACEILARVGNTPAIELDGITVKLEYFNPSGSVKDRFVFNHLERLRNEGKLPIGAKIAEATTGNTGISIAMWAALRGAAFTAFLPKNASEERLRIIRGYGAETRIAPTVGAAVAAKEEFLHANPGAVTLDQFANQDNPHFMEALGQELLQFKPDVFVAGVGTGGTLIGAARVLTAGFETKIIAVEPSESPLLTKGKCGEHPIEGIGEDFIPKIIGRERNIIDEVAVVRGEDAVAEMRRLWARGHFAGVSSAANLLVAKRYAKCGARVATLFPDNGYRYFFTK